MGNSIRLLISLGHVFYTPIGQGEKAIVTLETPTRSLLVGRNAGF